MSELKKAAVLAIGSELLGPDRSDTNSLRIAAALEPLGIALVEKRVIGDETGALIAALRALDDDPRVDLIVSSGGLGPTADDLSREAVAEAYSIDLQRDPATEAALVARYQAHGRELPEFAAKVADRLVGAELLANAVGSAPGQLIESPGGTLVVMLPGVPVELEVMLDAEVVPRLEARWGRRGLLRRQLLIGGLGEAEVEARLEDLWEDWGQSMSILASPGEVRLRFRSSDEAALDAVVAEVEQRFGIATIGDHTGLPAAVVERLRDTGTTLAVAESCTGGMLGSLITEVAGASAVFHGGVIAYANQVKVAELGVEQALLEGDGAVSEAVARAMAEGVRERFGVDFGLSITGVAGPGGGSEDKPVGTVWHGIADADGSVAVSILHQGDRRSIRRKSAMRALEMLRRALGR